MIAFKWWEHVTIESFIYLPILSMGQTMMVFTGQNFGAGKFDRIREGARKGLILGIGITLLLTGICLIFRESLIWVLLKDERIVRIGAGIMGITLPFYFLYAILEITGGITRGLSNTIGPMRNSILFLSGSRILLILLWAQKGNDINRLVLVYPVTWGLCAFFNYRLMKKELKRRSK
ncbi:Na+-driven multidrug efflux pump [Aequitasia blattaphilus]|uniref:Probable multidrug resistance protein NorM n=1 Tax=Aequitasia blattaphilus TaxID=2949332 RepID=A0ABT1ECK0_9FIRM|nr:MATE family efflux transporter [Aequitasia blattaphilus]MCP1103565.1 MATE family efflux transporter [Aequitasia blattaphilus]MCR8616205.1 MATE family efflux transporter [Aequitasia blattaphilus]